MAELSLGAADKEHAANRLRLLPNGKPKGFRSEVFKTQIYVLFLNNDKQVIRVQSDWDFVLEHGRVENALSIEEENVPIDETDRKRSGDTSGEVIRPYLYDYVYNLLMYLARYGYGDQAATKDLCYHAFRLIVTVPDCMVVLNRVYEDMWTSNRPRRFVLEDLTFEMVEDRLLPRKARNVYVVFKEWLGFTQVIPMHPRSTQYPHVFTEEMVAHKFEDIEWIAAIRDRQMRFARDRAIRKLNHS